MDHMSNETFVLNKFRDEVIAHFEIIKDCVKRDQRKEAEEWLKELLVMKENLNKILATPNNKILTGSFARGWKVGADNSHLKTMAQKRKKAVAKKTTKRKKTTKKTSKRRRR